MKIFTPEDSVNLKCHTYKTMGRSALDPLFQIWWSWVLQFIPDSVPANVITVSGLIISVGSSSVQIFYAYHFTEIPRWTAMLCGVAATFVAQTLDGIDGKQARRTSSSSPFGEFLDHGADAVITIFLTVAFCVSIGIKSSPVFMYFFFVRVSSPYATYPTGTHMSQESSNFMQRT